MIIMILIMIKRTTMMKIGSKLRKISKTNTATTSVNTTTYCCYYYDDDDKNSYNAKNKENK